MRASVVAQFPDACLEAGDTQALAVDDRIRPLKLVLLERRNSGHLVQVQLLLVDLGKQAREVAEDGVARAARVGIG